MSISGIAHCTGPNRAPGPYPFDLRNLNRLIGRGGRIADTHDPVCYAVVLRLLLRRFGNSLRYGFMLPVNLLLNGVVDHPIYHEPRVPQLTAMAIFRQQHGLWRVRAVLAVTGGVQLAMLVKGNGALGMDLSQSRFDKIDNAHCTAVLILPSPQASCARVDHDRSRLFALTSDGLWAITPGTRDYLAVVNKAMAEAQDLVASAARNNEADERARRHAVVLLSVFFHSVGWEIRIRWADQLS